MSNDDFDQESFDRIRSEEQFLIDYRRDRMISTANESGSTFKWVIATNATINTAGIGLLASRNLITYGDQVAMSILLLSSSVVIISGWLYSNSLRYLSRFHRHLALRAVKDAPPPGDVWRRQSDGSYYFNYMSAFAMFVSIFLTLTGGLIGIWF